MYTYNDIHNAELQWTGFFQNREVTPLNIDIKIFKNILKCYSFLLDLYHKDLSAKMLLSKVKICER